MTERRTVENVFWYYKSNDNPWSNTLTSDSTSSEWSKYRDIEIELIEEAFQRGDSHVTLDRYRLDFSSLIQVRLDDETKRRPIKRETGSSQQMCVREHRFTSSIPVESTDTASSYGSHDAWCPFLKYWQETAAGIRACLRLAVGVEACAQGIVKEAALRDDYSNTEAAYMAEKLRSCWQRTNSKIEVLECCIKFYTRETFLYKTLNTAVRQCDRSKLDTLGPLAYLLHEYSRMNTGFTGTVYRGLTLTTTELESYRQPREQWLTWLSYTSTSKNREVAEMFGINTLLIIQISDFQLGLVRGCDISHLSKYSDEEEVLLPAGVNFRVISFEQNAQQKYVIHIEV